MKNELLRNLNKDMEDKNIRRCMKALKEKGLPLYGWECIEVYDCKENDKDAPLEICELCGCDKVRFVHVMQCDDMELRVGCICAGVMEGDMIVAKERERLLRNRANRKKNFMKRKWKRVMRGFYTMQYKGKRLSLRKTGFGAVLICDKKSITRYNGYPITNYTLASHAAFDLVDPLSEVLMCENE